MAQVLDADWKSPAFGILAGDLIEVSNSKGIGKSTFAYHLINYIFSQKEEDRYDSENNIISPNNFSYNLIKNGTHPNFFLISNNAEKSNSQISKIRENSLF